MPTGVYKRTKPDWKKGKHLIHSGSFRKGHSVPQEWRIKFREAHKGKSSWSKGKHLIHSGSFKKGHGLLFDPIVLKGRHLSLQTEFKKGFIPWNKGLKGFMAGEKNPRWKGGITSEQSKIRNSLEYIVWRNEVWKRDNWTCRICGKKCQKGNIVAHHLHLFSDFPELRFSVDNGITFCKSCHAKIHLLGRRKKWKNSLSNVYLAEL